MGLLHFFSIYPYAWRNSAKPKFDSDERPSTTYLLDEYFRETPTSLVINRRRVSECDSLEEAFMYLTMFEPGAVCFLAKDFFSFNPSYIFENGTKGLKEMSVSSIVDFGMPEDEVVVLI